MYFILDSVHSNLDYINIGFSLDEYSRACSKSEFQFLDRNSISIDVSKDSGSIWQDFMFELGIPLISDRVKDFFDSLNIDYLFYKKVILKRSDFGQEEIYWIALPEKIDCLDFENSTVDEFLNIANKIVIDDEQIGRYDIFKISNVQNDVIVITEKLANLIKQQDFIGFDIYDLSEFEE